MSLRGKVALVTGSGQGIGRSMALCLANQGIHIAINDVTFNAEKAAETAAQVRELGPDAETFLADVSKEAQVDEMVQRVLARFGRIDILINNAGINRDGLLHKGVTTDWDAVMAVNLTGPFLCTKAVLPAMRREGFGRIVNLASVTGRTGVFGTGYYATSKAGLIGLTKVTAVENAAKGITVNALAPGYIKTDMMLKYPEEQLKAIIGKIPAGRLAEPEEIAEAALFLINAPYVNGAVLDINGGFYI
ncbi:MAG TPA: 3-oxoacyl-ACP reductase FabG [Verrucomicrobiae bacterium]|nr:3-oxoacyl-ACP reductase FabG [Verrucomicrobiae bacterium]